MSNEHNNAPAVPQGWVIKFEGNDISVSNDHMGCIVPHTETEDRRMPSEVLHALCRDLLAATPAPAPAQEVGLTDEALDNLIEDLSEWSRHVVEDTAHQTLEAHVREVLAKNTIIAALRAKGGK